MRYVNLRPLRTVDAVIVAFMVFLSVFDVVFSAKIAGWYLFVAANFAVIGGVIALAHSFERTGNPALGLVRDWYPAGLIFFSFKEMYVIIQGMGRGDFDALFIAADRWLFGVDPTVWVSRFASPLVTEILQIAYMSFYFLMIAFAVELAVKRERGKFDYVFFVVIYGFFLSYLGYLTFPAVGPRFTLHDFTATDTELPGVWLAAGIRDFLNAGESIPKGAMNAIAIAQRDVFPSGHTQMTLIVMFLAWKYKIRIRHVLYLFGSLLVVSTVYLRYHYVVDVLAGAVFAWFTLWTAPGIDRWWGRKRQQ